MSKSCCFAVVLAVICLSVILLSLAADAQPTIDETMTSSASTLEEVMNMVKIVASNQQQHAQKIKQINDEIKSLKTLLVSGSVETNDTRLEEVVQEIKDKIDNEMDLLRDEVKNVKRLLPFVTLEPSKQSLVFELICEYVRCS